MLNKDNNNSQFIEGNSRVRLALFVFLGLWILTGFLLKPITEKRIENIKTMPQSTPTIVLNEIILVTIKFGVIPHTIFFSIQGLYLLWLGIKTMKAGIHPPPGVKMPFRTRLRVGRRAKITALGYFFASLCQFAAVVAVIVFTISVRNDILKHI